MWFESIHTVDHIVHPRTGWQYSSYVLPAAGHRSARPTLMDSNRPAAPARVPRMENCVAVFHPLHGNHVYPQARRWWVYLTALG